MEVVLQRLRKLDVCVLSDALDALGLPAAVSGISRRSGQSMLVGTVITVELAPGPAPAGAPRVHLGARAIEAGGVGSVIVVSHPGVDAGGWGGVLSNGAVCAGIEGVIVDGPTRDIDEAIDLKFPVFARATTARTARGRVHEIATNGPITIAGVTVEPQDYVAADGSGVVFVPRARIDAVLEAAERIAGREQVMTSAIRAGNPVSRVMGADYEDMLKVMR